MGFYPQSVCTRPPHKDQEPNLTQRSFGPWDDEPLERLASTESQPGRRRHTAGGAFVSFFLGIGEETGNEAEVEADWAVFIGDFEGFLVSWAGMKTAGIAI
jgi:hypothetical protein